MNVLLALGVWVGLSVPVSLVVGGLLARDGAERPERSLIRENVTPTQLA